MYSKYTEPSGQLSVFNTNFKCKQNMWTPCAVCYTHFIPKYLFLEILSMSSLSLQQSFNAFWVVYFPIGVNKRVKCNMVILLLKSIKNLKHAMQLDSISKPEGNHNHYRIICNSQSTWVYSKRLWLLQVTFVKNRTISWFETTNSEN